MNLKVASTFTEVDKKIHERKRRLVSHGFSDASLRLYEPRILTNVTKLVNRILSSKKAEDGWTESLNIGDFGMSKIQWYGVRTF